ncbi:hypothetical protein ACOBQX_19750 [Actinokineospora sp. G85]|uniref:hypothetical protein n=1 Tax=Actinokineospora sp. G85 TaxID=3406626 RepID=UPI003C72DF1D
MLTPAVASAAPHSPPTARVLPAPEGGSRAEPYGQTASGLIFGRAYTAEGNAAAVTWRDGTPSLLDPTAAASVAIRANLLDQIVGTRAAAGAESRAVVWSNGRARELLPPGAVSSSGWDINNRGDVLLTSVQDTGATRLSLWRSGRFTTITEGKDPRGELSDSGKVAYSRADDAVVRLFPGGRELGPGTPVDINARNQVLIGHERRLALWTAGSRVDIGDLGGGSTHTGGGPVSYGPWLNDSGRVVASSTTANGELHAVTWKDGVLTDVTPSPPNLSWGLAVNQAGTVSAATTQPKPGLFLWTNGKTTALPVPGGEGYPSASALHPFLPRTAGIVVGRDFFTSTAYEWR